MTRSLKSSDSKHINEISASGGGVGGVDVYTRLRFACFSYDGYERVAAQRITNREYNLREIHQRTELRETTIHAGR